MNALQLFIFGLAFRISLASVHPPVLFPGSLSTRLHQYNNYVGPQDVAVESIKASPFGSDIGGPSKWRHAFFKQQNLVCGFNTTNVHVFSQKIFNRGPSNRLHSFRVSPDEETIVDAVVFHRDDGFARLGVVSRKKWNHRQSVSGILREFKIGEKVTELFKIELQGNPSALKFVCGLQGCAYAILVEHDKPEIEAERVHYPTEDINVVEIRLQNAISLASVRLQGVRHLVVGSRSTVYVFRLNHFLTSSKLISTIPFAELRSIGAFRSGPSAYVALTTDSRQKIVELRHDGGWRTVHELSIRSATQFVPVYSVSFGTHILALTTRDASRPLRLFFFSGYSNVLHEIQHQNIVAQLLVLENSVATFGGSQQHLTLLFFDALNQHPALVDLKYNLPHLRAPFHELKQEAARRIGAAKARLLQYGGALRDAESVMERGAPKKPHLHRIPRHAKFREIEVRGAVHTKLEPSVRIGVVNSNIVIQPDESLVEDSSSKLRELREHLRKAKEVLDKAILKSSSQPIRISTLSIAGSIRCPQIESKTTSLARLRKESAREMIDSLYFIGENSTLKGRLIFHGGISASSFAVSTLNHRRVPQDIVIAGEDLRLFGEYNFTKGLSLETNSEVHGPLGPLSDTAKLLRVSGSVLPSLRGKNFDTVVVRERVDARSVNGLNLRKLSGKLLNFDSDQIILTPIILHGNARTASLTVDSANGLKLKAPLTRFVYPDIPAVVTGRKNFESVHFKGGLHARHTLNGLRIPEDLMLRHAEQRVTAPKTFSGDLTATSIIQSGLLNGFSYPREVVSLTLPSSISGHVEFRQGADFNSIRTLGPIDHLNVNEFMGRKNFSLYARPVVFHGAVVADEVHIKGSLDGEDIQKVWDDIIPAPSDPRGSLGAVEISGEKTFSGGISARAVHAPLINGLNTHEDLASVGKPIGGRKILRGNLRVNHLSSTNSLLNGINVRATFNERVTLSTPQTISKPLILRDLRTNKLSVMRLNGTRFPADFITTHLTENVTGDLRCNQVVIRSKDLRPNEKISTPFVAGISNAMKRRLRLDGQINLTSVILENVNSRFVDAARVDGFDFANFARRVLRDDQGEIKLSGKNVFENIVFEAPFSTQAVNGFDLARLNKLAVSTIRPTTIRVPIAFRDGIVLNGPMVTSKINSQKADVLNTIASSKDSRILAPVRFRKEVRSGGPVDARSVNNAVLGRDFLTISTPQTIPANVAFGGTLFVEERLDGATTINGIDIQKLEKSLARASPGGRIFVNSSLIFEAPVSLEEDLHATEVNGEVLRKLVTRAPCLSEGILNTLEIRGGLELTHGALVHSYNNRKSLPAMMTQMVFNDGRAYHLKQTTFRNLRVEGALACKELQHEGLLNGFALERILRGGLPIASPEPFIFKGSLILNAPTTIDELVVDGEVNGIHLPEGVIRRCVNCGTQKLQNVTVLSMDVANVTAVSSDHPSYELWNAIKENKIVSLEEVTDSVLKGHRPVKKLIVDGNLAVGTVNTELFTQRLVRIDGGPIVLKAPVFDEASFNNLVLRSHGRTHCTSGGLVCQIRSLQRRKCFDWHSEMPRFQHVILERGVQTRSINGVDLEPEKLKKLAAVNTLRLRLEHAQNYLEEVKNLDERLLDC